MITGNPDYALQAPMITGWRQPDLTPAGSGSTPLHLILRWKWRILGFACVVTALAGVVIWHLAPRYAAESSVMIDVRQMRVINSDGLMSSPLLDESLVRSDMEAFGSLELARSVVQSLGLTKSPEFCGTHNGTNASADAGCEARLDDVSKSLLQGVTATNDGRSYIIRIRAEAGDPALAASIANAYADAFVAQRQKMRSQVSQRATTWLTSYVEQLRAQTTAADAAAAQYRNEHHLIPLQGQTTASQSMSALNVELSTLDNEIAEKQSVAEQVSGMLHGGGDASAVAPMLNSPLISGLIDREAELASTEAELKTQLGSAHPQVLAASARVGQMRSQIRSEVSKAVAGLNRELAALNQRKAMLTAQMNSAQTKMGQQGTDDVGLQSLESNATSARNVYQNALTRLRELEAEQGMAQSDATVASEAIVPDKPSFPHKSVMLAGSFLGSLGLGAGLAFVLSLASRSFRDAEHLEEESGLRMLGVFPRPAGGRPPEDMALDTPLSVQGETLHSVLINLTSAIPARPDGLGKVVLVTSATPGEGKTSFCLALGRSAMRWDLSAVLLDCDLRRPSVQALLDENGQAVAATETTSGRTDDSNRRLIVDRRSGLHIIPLKLKNSGPQLLSASMLRNLLQQLREKYDLILLDMPPVLAVADALTASPLADGVVLVVDFQRTPRRAFSDAVQMLQRNGAVIAGTVLTKGELPKYAQAYGGYGYLAPAAAPRRTLLAGG